MLQVPFYNAFKLLFLLATSAFQVHQIKEGKENAKNILHFSSTSVHKFLSLEQSPHKSNSKSSNFQY